MALLLVQHGKSLSKEVDPERGLSDEGKKETELMATILCEHNVKVSSVEHSGKKRARETAEIFMAHLGSSADMRERNGLAPLDDVTNIDIEPDKNIMLIGHLPFMEKLVSFLTTGSAERESIVKFQNSGIVALDKNKETGSWYVKWMLSPKVEA